MVKQSDNYAGVGKLSYQQQELINVLNDELMELSKEQIDLISDFSEGKFKSETLQQKLDEQIDKVGRVGSASRIIGLSGLERVTGHIQKNFELIKSQHISRKSIVDSQLLHWPNLIQRYLNNISDPGFSQVVLEYLNHKALPNRINQQEKIKIEKAFSNSTIQIDTNERIQTATPDLVSIEISDDVDTDVIENLLLNLPKQTAKLSTAVKSLRGADFIDQLEIAEKVAHTLKGVGNTVGISGIANITHCLEDILEVLLKAKKRPSASLHEALQNATECLEEMSDYLEGIGSKPEHAVKVFQEILTWANNINSYGLGDQSENIVDSDNKDDGLKISNIAATTENSIESSAGLSHRVSAKLVDDLLNSTGDTIITSEQIAELVLSLKSSFQNIISSNKKVKSRAYEVENLIGFENQTGILISQEHNQQEQDQYAELQAAANHLIEATEDTSEFSSHIQNTLHLLERHSLNQIRMLQDNQNAVLRIRMIPVESIVPRLQRAVKQVCKSSNKSAKLSISGEETLVDSEFLHQLEDSIMHILHNAVVHGIEMPDVRVKHGKNAQGEIHLSFDREGNTIRVACQDDGCGLDYDRIKDKAIENKLLSRNDVIEDEDAIQMILRHGFSTQDKASHFSGRGVGLTTVHEIVKEMKGTIAIDSRKGNGLNVGISVPTNLNSLHALLVGCEDFKIAISNRGIEEILHSRAGNIILVSGEYYIEYMQQRYPVFDLGYMLERSQKNQPQNSNSVLLVKENANKIYAVTIDKIYDTRDIIAKPISELVPNDAGLLGTTILGDGTISAVIDIVELLKHARLLKSKSFSKVQVEKNETSQPLALVVDDSISSRQKLAQMLQELGFSVKMARDGVEALRQIKEVHPAIVLTDLEMPRMNGIELSAHIRSKEAIASTPIVMIASNSFLQKQQELADLKISASITKPYDEDELLDVINSLNLIDHVIA